MRWLVASLFLAACDDSLVAGGSGVDAGADDDPLIFTDSPEVGSLDHIHRTIVQPSCAGQPGLCHAGQFEPLMATPASFYAALVNRPGLEHPEQMRVAPGAANASLIIDKLRGRNVATRMPLGAEPLGEDQIVLIEAWIDAGAPRRPGEQAPAPLNELPHAPEIAVYEGNQRLDGASPAAVAVGDTVTLRLSTRDFETPDASIAFAALILVAPDGRQLVVAPGSQDPQVAATEYDPSGPASLGDLLNRRFVWTVPATISLRNPDTGAIQDDVPVAGLVISAFAVYLDSFAEDGIAVLGIRQNLLEVE